MVYGPLKAAPLIAKKWSTDAPSRLGLRSLSYRPVTSGHLGVRDDGCLSANHQSWHEQPPSLHLAIPQKALRGVGASGIVNNHGPLIAAGARKNEKINTLVVH